MGRLWKPWCQPALLVLQLLVASQGSGLKGQSPVAADLAALRAARKQHDTAERTASLQSFLIEFPSSSYRGTAQALLLTNLLATEPVPLAAVHTLATQQIADAAPGIERWMTEAHLATVLADAGPAGVDLNDARVWAQTALQAFTEAAYAHQMAAAQARYHLPPLTPRQRHQQFALDRATVLAAAADVDLRSGQTAHAAFLLTEATQRDPLSPEVARLHAELALAQGQRPEALEAFLRADALRPLPPRWRTAEQQLFTALTGGDAAALDARVDATAAALYPTPFRLPPRALPAGGHPALLELFTGSDCLPCTGADLAVDSLLTTYSRTDLLVLELDEHIPHPDPLATPGTVALAERAGVEATPTALLDGRPLPILGSNRADVENIVVGLADAIETEASLPSQLELTLTVTGGDGRLTVRPRLALAPRLAGPVSATTGDASLRTLATATLHLALVADPLRYPGANGVRLHRMVVRDLQQLPAASLLVNSTTPPAVTFDPPAIERELSGYLHTFEANNDSFGSFTFPVTDFPLPADHLAVVAWVEDTRSQRVLQSAFAAVQAP